MLRTVRRPLVAALAVVLGLAVLRVATVERVADSTAFAAASDPDLFGLSGSRAPARARAVATPATNQRDGRQGITIRGTDGPDRIRGTADDDMLLGRGGADNLTGGAGNDLLVGGPGRDILDGGAGDDWISAEADGSVDTIRCGAGRDVVTAELADKVAAGCEVVSRQLSRDRTTTSFASQHQTQVEPDSFSASSVLVTAYQIGRFAYGGAAAIGWSTTRNGGKTWRSGLLPSLSEESRPAGPYSRVSDPVVGWDAVHRVWLIGTLVANDQGSLVVSRSRDGVTWSAPETVPKGDSEEIDKEWITCDNWTSSPFRGRCYLSYLDVDSHQIRTRYSDDGGLSWSGAAAPTVGAPQPIVNGAQPVVRPNGELVVAFAGYATYGRPDQDAILATRSADGGATFTPLATVARVTIREVNGMRTAPLPSADIDSSGIVYLAWQDCSGFREGCDIVVSRSPVGDTWSVPELAAGGEGFPPTDEFVPALAVDPATSGRNARLAIVYYSRAEPEACGLGICAWVDVFTKESRDGGSTWTEPQRINTQSMPLEWIADAGFGRLLGDYISVSWTGGRAVPVYALASTPVGEEFRQAVFAGAR
jgi:RTX calcium-binding nonapeptide repeat (4 copies)